MLTNVEWKFSLNYFKTLSQISRPKSLSVQHRCFLFYHTLLFSTHGNFSTCPLTANATPANAKFNETRNIGKFMGFSLLLWCFLNLPVDIEKEICGNYKGGWGKHFKVRGLWVRFGRELTICIPRVTICLHHLVLLVIYFSHALLQGWHTAFLQGQVLLL